MSMTRLDVHDVIEHIVGNDHVYYQPPESFRMQYPCAVYNIQRVRPTYANDGSYIQHDEYLVTYICYDPDDPVINDFRNARGFVFDRHFTSDNLHHTVFRYVVY